MKIIFITYLSFIIAFSSFGQNENESKMILVFAKNSFHNIKPEDAKATAQILSDHIKKVKKIKKYSTVKLAENDQEILDICKNDFDLALVTTEQYIKFKSKLPLEPFCTNFANGNYGYVYHLIVNINDNISDIKQLKGETIYIQAHTQDQAATLWLNKLLRAEKLPLKEKFFGKVFIDNKATNVLLPVFFKKAKACIVTDASLKLLLELNPGIKNQIKILDTSDPILLGVLCLNASKKNGENYNSLKDALLVLHENQYGKQFLDLFRAEKLVPFKEEYLEGYFNLSK